MNIALLLPSLGGGGAERVAQQLGNHYAEKGDNVYYFLGLTNKKKDYDVKGTIVHTGIGLVDVVRDYGMVFFLYNMAKSVWRIRNLKRQYKIDVSISFMEDFNYLNVLSKINDKVIVRVCTIISECEELSDKILYRKNWLRRVYSNADKVVVMSRFAYKEMVDIYGISKEKVKVIPNSVAPMFKEEVREIPWPYGEKVIVAVGRLSAEKNHDRLLRAFRIVSEKIDEARLIILGQGPLLQYLKGICRLYGLEDKVYFRGFVKNPSIYLKKAQLFAMVSKIEGFGNAMIEAMSCGCPIVATDSPGGMQDIMCEGDTRYGIMTASMPRKKLSIDDELTSEELEFGKAMLSLLENEDMRNEFRKRSLIRAGDYEMEKVMKIWDDMLSKLV